MYIVQWTVAYARILDFILHSLSIYSSRLRTHTLQCAVCTQIAELPVLFKSLPLLWNTFLKWIKLLNNAREKYITNINLYENKKRSTFNRFQDTYRAPFFFWIPIWWSSIHKPGISKEINFPLISLTCCMFVHIFYGKFTIFSLFALKNPLKNHQHINNNAIRMWNNNQNLHSMTVTVSLVLVNA